MDTILQLEPIKKFLQAVEQDVERYFGKDPACIVYLKPDGVFYAKALYDRLRKKKRDITITTMEDDGRGLEEDKIRRRKVLIVDNDIVSGKGYKRSMEALRAKKERLQIEDIKFATSLDRRELADFAAESYSIESFWRLEDVDALDLKIITLLSRDGRMSFADIGEEVHLSAVAVKNRIDKLLQSKVLRIQGTLNIERFYSLSAGIQIEVEKKHMRGMIERLQKKHEVYHIARRLGKYNLTVSVFVQNIEDVEEFIENEVRAYPGVKQLEVHVGELPVLPKTFLLHE